MEKICLTNAMTMLSPAMLLSLQYRNCKFIAVDTLVRYGAIDGLLRGRAEDVELYKKMQQLRGPFETWENFKELIASFKGRGFAPDFPIETDMSGTLYDGSHRLACSLYFDITLLPVLCVKDKFERDYSFEWFASVGFTPEELKRIRHWQYLVFSEKGIYFRVILMSSAVGHFDEIETDIARYYSVVGRREIICDDALFERLSRAVCGTDDITDLVLKKHYIIGTQKNYVRFLEIQPPPHLSEKLQWKISVC